MQFLENVKKRYACRDFIEYTIRKEELDYILEAGCLAPSSLGLEPWRFYVVQDSKKKQEIAQIANGQNHLITCSAIIIIAARLDFGEYFIEKLQKRGLSQDALESRIALYKPFIDGMDSKDKLHYAREQTHLALMQCVYAAVDLGLDSCIIGGFDCAKLDAYLKLDDKEKTSIILVVGKGREKGGAKIRNAKDEVIKFL